MWHQAIAWTNVDRYPWRNELSQDAWACLLQTFRKAMLVVLYIHNNDVIWVSWASLIGGNSTVGSTHCWWWSQRKHWSSTLLDIYEGISVHKGSVIWKALTFYTLSHDLRYDSFISIMNAYNMIKRSWHFLQMFYHWFRELFVACLLPSCCLDQCQYLVISTIWSIFQWNLNEIKANVIGSKMSSVKLRPCCLGPNMLKNLESKFL